MHSTLSLPRIAIFKKQKATYYSNLKVIQIWIIPCKHENISTCVEDHSLKYYNIDGLIMYLFGKYTVGIQQFLINFPDPII